MNTVIRALLQAEHIEFSGIIPFSLCRVIHEQLLFRTFGEKEPKSVIMLLVPYYVADFPERNVSLYAVARDYHLYFRELYERLCGKLSSAFPGFRFCGYADHSPIGETGAAARAGLGVIGDRFQLINRVYGSYTFLGEILTDYEFPTDEMDTVDVAFCPHCGRCGVSCPTENDCFSAMNQAKGKLSPETEAIIKKTGIGWGCDICRTVCPLNQNIRKTPIPFFCENLMPVVTPDDVLRMSKEEFSTRAWAWRGRKTILRNLEVLFSPDGDRHAESVSPETKEG